MRHLALLVAAMVWLTGCGDNTNNGEPAADLVVDTNLNDGPDSAVDIEEPAAIAGVQIAMDYTRSGGFYSAPFPDDSLVGEAGIALSEFPNPSNIPLVESLVEIVSGSSGFGTTSGVYFSLDAPVGDQLPSLHQSIGDAAPVMLIDVDRDSDYRLRRYPVSVHFTAEGGPFGAPNLLSLLPLQGVPLEPDTVYAAVVLRSLGDAEGRELGVSLEMAQLAAGIRPDGLGEDQFDALREALDLLDESGLDRSQLAGIALFTTWSPHTEFVEAVAQVQALPQPEPNALLEAAEVFDDYCVFQTTIDMPTYQAGTPPFLSDGGGWLHDEGGNLELQGTETSNLVVTVPRGEQPDAGFPAVVFIRTGGGGDRPLVDRGHRSESGGDSDAPGSGPAMHFALAGFAGISVDGPHGGLRNVTGGDEQFLMFNINNPTALRDNVRQSALELALLADIIADLELDATSCPGLEDVSVAFDADHLALMGHSMGATIAPLVMAAQPRYGALILSGAGGSWIENVMFKEKPLEVRPLAEIMLSYPTDGLHRHDPVLSLLQWAGEPADPPVYGRFLIDARLAGNARHVLMLQGIVDHYIMPPIANATTLSIGLDLAGLQLDADHPELVDHDPIASLLDLVERTEMPYPVEGNRGTATAVVVQHPEGGIEDGHEVVFQTAAPQFQYRCFLESWLEGRPRVLEGASVDDPCQ